MHVFRLVTLRAVGLAGFAIFAFFFTLTFSVPAWVEDFAENYIRGEVSAEVDQTIDLLRAPEGGGPLSRLAQDIESRNSEKILGLKQALKDRVHGTMADAIAEIRDLDCECRAKWEQAIRRGMESRISLLGVANEKVVDFIQSEYMQVVSGLKKEIRIFTGINALVFLALVTVSLLKKRAVVHLFIPGALLVISTLICSYFYVFKQNWLLTIIHSNYVGVFYVFYLGMVFGFLCDIAFNSARVTRLIVDAIMNAIGSAATLGPC